MATFYDPQTKTFTDVLNIIKNFLNEKLYGWSLLDIRQLYVW
jgi:hypothetical protein